MSKIGRLKIQERAICTICGCSFDDCECNFCDICLCYHLPEDFGDEYCYACEGNMVDDEED